MLSLDCRRPVKLESWIMLGVGEVRGTCRQYWWKWRLVHDSSAKEHSGTGGQLGDAYPKTHHSLAQWHIPEKSHPHILKEKIDSHHSAFVGWESAAEKMERVHWGRWAEYFMQQLEEWTRWTHNDVDRSLKCNVFEKGKRKHETHNTMLCELKMYVHKIIMHIGEGIQTKWHAR
jgi:hypothetical protein